MTENNKQNIPVIVWFRRDLRVADNPALHAAIQTRQPVIPLFIFDTPAPKPIGAASQWWLHHALKELNEALLKCGNKLILRKGNSQQILTDIIKSTQANALFWNRRYVESEIEIDKQIKADLSSSKVQVESFNGSLLREPWEVKTGQGTYYKVYTPFWRTLQKIEPARSAPLPSPKKILAPKKYPRSDAINSWTLTPKNPNWAKSFPEFWGPTLATSRKNLSHFLKNAVRDYETNRDYPAIHGTSKLSPYLAWGQISPLEIWHETHNFIASNSITQTQGLKFLSQIAWREFSMHLLFYNPAMATKPLRSEFSQYPWRDNKENLQRWQQGKTGYPIVDAGMRQLWQTGWMHNRVRMICASFLIKHLLIPWQLGEEWFWDTLLDADLANNSAGWQWVAGCGADAAPYFRIFNPFGQGEKFDSDGAYVKTYVPEISTLPNKYIHQPWTAPSAVLEKHNIILDKTYPAPMIDHRFARERALEGYQKIKGVTATDMKG